MKTGELTDSVRNRSVFRELHTDSVRTVRDCLPDCAAPEEKYGGLPERAASAYRPEASPEQVISIIGPLPGFTDMPWRQVTAAANSLVTDGAEPQTLLLQGLLSQDTEESALREMMRQFALEAKSVGLSFSDANIQVSGCVSAPQFFVTGIGTRCLLTEGSRPSTGAEGIPKTPSIKKTLPAEKSAISKLTPGQDLVAVRQIGLAGTAALARAYEFRLRERYPAWLIDRAKSFGRWMSVAEAARAVNHFGGCSVRRIAQGGIFNALWEMADASGVGLEVDHRKIPVCQETIEICEYFDINPYYLYSEGAVLVGTDRAEELIAVLADKGIPASVIGRTTEGNDRVIRNGENRRYLDRPQQDELWRLSEKETRAGRKGNQ